MGYVLERDFYHKVPKNRLIRIWTTNFALDELNVVQLFLPRMVYSGEILLACTVGVRVTWQGIQRIQID